MPDPDDLEPRVTALERDVASAAENASQARAEAREALMLNRACDRDQGDFTGKLAAHTLTLNAVRETQLEHGERLARLEHDLRTGLTAMTGRLDETVGRIDGLDREVRTGFATLAQGMAHITALLTRIGDQRS